MTMNQTRHTTTPVAPPDATPSNPTDADRRAALRRLGVMVALTPPTLMTLLLSRRTSAASLGPEPGDP